ncbi:MAG TPA: PorV/PorQ family protein [Candidatus Kapabacteria bacterium]
MIGNVFTKKFMLSAMLILTSAGAYAQSSLSTTAEDFNNVGGSGAAFQKVWAGARSAGMAGGFSALANDVYSIYWNPAGIARTKGISTGAAYTSWYGNINYNFIGAVVPLSEKFRAGVSLVVMDYGNLRATTLEYDANRGNFNANDMSFGVTIAGAMTERFSFGATVKYLRNAILDMSADGVGFDAGSLYQTDFYKMKISLALTNLGPDRSFSGNSLAILATQDRLNTTNEKLDATLATSGFPLPLNFKIGLATDVFQGEMQDQQLNVAFDFTESTDGPQRYNLGAEYVYNNIVALRAGYAFNHDQLGLGIGAGYKFKSDDFLGDIDYAYNTSNNFGGIHTVSIIATFP